MQTQALRSKLAKAAEQQGPGGPDPAEVERLRQQLQQALRSEERLRQQLLEVRLCMQSPSLLERPCTSCKGVMHMQESQRVAPPPAASPIPSPPAAEASSIVVLQPEKLNERDRTEPAAVQPAEGSPLPPTQPSTSGLTSLLVSATPSRCLLQLHMHAAERLCA
jgi:hypothetical protein